MMTVNWTDGAGRLVAGNRELEWAAFGPAPGQDLAFVLLHEGLGCVALWRDFPKRLAEITGRPVFAYSRAGYGQSDAADPETDTDAETKIKTEVKAEPEPVLTKAEPVSPAASETNANSPASDG